MGHLFISYVNENYSKVRMIHDALLDLGIDVWLDREKLQPGAYWKDTIRVAIRNGDFFVPFVSEEYLTKNRSFMNDELLVAIEELRSRPLTSSWFLPVLLSGEVPPIDIGAARTLRDIQWIDLQSIGVPKTVDMLVSVIAPEVLRKRGRLNDYVHGPRRHGYSSAPLQADPSTPLGRMVERAREKEADKVLFRLKEIWPSLEDYEKEFIIRLAGGGKEGISVEQCTYSRPRALDVLKFNVSKTPETASALNVAWLFDVEPGYADWDENLLHIPLVTKKGLAKFLTTLNS